ILADAKRPSYRVRMASGFDSDPAGGDVLARLAAVGFSEPSGCSRLGLDDLNDLQLRATAIYRSERLQPRDPLASAIDLFMLQGVLSANELDQLFEPAQQQALLACGLLGRADGERGETGAVRTLASLYPVGPELLFSDHASHELDHHALGADTPDRERLVDLSTAIPPFVPAPEQKVGCRVGGPSGEEVQRRIIEGLPRHLKKGGLAQIVTEFGESDADPLERRLRRWLGDAAIDLHVLRLRTHAAQPSAIGHADGDEPEVFLRSVGAWAANLRAHGYTRVVSVLLAFQWREASHWS